jgi:leader peptidase (prepilin peptidase)/N-methyltransferase
MAFEHIIVAVFGLICGSFLNVCVYRIPRRVMFSHSRSFCPQCSAVISWYDNIPVLSFLFLRGTTRCCQSKISIQYPITEILSAVAFIFWFWRFPFFTYSISPPLVGITSWPNLFRFFHASLFSLYLLFIIWVDGRYKIIPRVWSLCFLALLPVIVFAHPELDARSSILGVGLGAAIVYLIAWTYFLVRRRVGIGFGDVWLMAVIGGWLGYQHLLAVLFLGSILASAFALGLMIWRKNLRKLDLEVPFGPFLSVAAIFILAVGPDFLSFWTL